MKVIQVFVLTALLIAGRANAEELVVKIHLLTEQGVGQEIGTVKAEETPYGVLFTPNLTNLPQGLHGFHVHEHGDCGPAMKEGKMTAGMAAGGHYDPESKSAHKGPYGDGHLGDLPALSAEADGTVTLPVLAPRLKLSDLKGRSLMIHSGADNYSDTPKPLGGGGARLASGIVS